MADDLEDYRALEFMPSRIPAQDAVEAFVPTGQAPDEELQEMISRTGASRWYPEQDGQRLRVLYDGGGYNPERFALVPGGWDHEHCSRCGGVVEPMTLCWVTKQDPFVLIDEKCHREIFRTA